MKTEQMKIQEMQDMLGTISDAEYTDGEILSLMKEALRTASARGIGNFIHRISDAEYTEDELERIFQFAVAEAQ